MNTIDCSTFDCPRPLSTLRDHGERTADALFDFIAFLSAAQALKVDFLSMTWEMERGIVDSGGTSQINQSLVNSRMEFAFKRVGQSQRFDGRLFKVFANEMIVLRHPSIQQHPNIVELLGVCWDVSTENDDNRSTVTSAHLFSDAQVWPVLVFEKSQFGDLYHFAISPIGRALRAEERLKLCLDIGKAIADMHSYNIIHGDIKPQNVLIFKGSDEVFRAKVTDFGYATCYNHKEDGIQLPRSRPWQAPEYHPSEVKPAQAQKMDIFSLALLFLWLIFEKRLSGVERVPQDARWMDKNFSTKSGVHLWGAIEDLKDGGMLTNLSSHLLESDHYLDASTRQILEHFFSTALNIDPELRTADIVSSLELLGLERTMDVRQSLIDHRASTLDYNFEISLSLYDFYSTDYRVRSYITGCLEKRLMDVPGDPLGLQLAVCYFVGFGCRSSDENAFQILADCGMKVDLLWQALHQLNTPPGNSIESSIVQGLRHGGYIRSRELFDRYLREDKALGAETAIKHEIERFSFIFEHSHLVVPLLQGILVNLYMAQGRNGEAEELAIQSANTFRKFLGADGIDTLRGEAHLPAIYLRQGRWKMAEEHSLALNEKMKRVLGENHPETLASLAVLGAVYANQGSWKKSENIYTQLLEHSRRLLGDEHPETLSRMANLAAIYNRQGLLTKAAKLEESVLEATQKALGDEHPDTMSCIHNLASTYYQQGQVFRAEGLFYEVTELRKRILGEKHPETLRSMCNLATTYRFQRLYKSAQDIETQVWNTRQELLGEKHPETLVAMNNLACTLAAQCCYKEAIEMGTTCARGLEEAVGRDHHWTQASLRSLAAWTAEKAKEEG